MSIFSNQFEPTRDSELNCASAALQGRAPRLALGAFVTLLPAAMIPAALLSLGFPKPPDYSVLSRRLLSLQSDEVCAGGVGDG